MRLLLASEIAFRRKRDRARRQVEYISPEPERRVDIRRRGSYRSTRLEMVCSRNACDERV